MQSDPKKAALKAVGDRYRRAAVAVISATRRDLDMSQGELAKKLGWSRSRLGNLEAGRRKLAIDEFAVIAHALGMEPEALFRRIARW